MHYDQVLSRELQKEFPGVQGFSTRSRADIEAFKEAVAVHHRKRGDWLHCMCWGEEAVIIYRGRRKLANLTSHHGLRIRTSLWCSDAELVDSEKWIRWFEERGMPQLRENANQAANDRKQREEDYARWMAAMPKSLAPLWEYEKDPQIYVVLGSDVKSFYEALQKEFSDPREQALALFGWYGSGRECWSGGSYGSVPAELLLEIPTPILIEAAQSPDLTPAQTEGAARLFGGWAFSKQRPTDLETLPADLKAKLLAHSLESTNEDNKERARSAFENP